MLEVVAAVVLTAPAPPPDTLAHPAFPLVSIADAAEFGADWREAREMWAMACRHHAHHDAYLLANYRFADYEKWRAESDKCRAAWDALDNVLHPGMTKDRAYRAGQLDRLRRVIGDADYHSRRMPPPCPGWMFEPD